MAVYGCLLIHIDFVKMSDSVADLQEPLRKPLQAQAFAEVGEAGGTHPPVAVPILTKQAMIAM